MSLPRTHSPQQSPLRSPMNSPSSSSSFSVPSRSRTASRRSELSQGGMVYKQLSYKDHLAQLLTTKEPEIIGPYVLGEIVGKGSYGVVKVATHSLTQQQVAVKIMDKSVAPLAIREIETWRHLRHQNIAQLYEVLISETKIYLVMEYAKYGELFDYIVQRGRLKEKEGKHFFRQLVMAVGYCHSKGYVHRDLKPENLLLDGNYKLKVVDFGFTRQFEPGKLLSTFCGSAAYAAPEMISREKYSGPESDLWSLGVILFALLNGRLPFDDDNGNEMEIFRRILNLDYRFEDISPEAQDLISKILKKNPKDRLGIQGILSHEWLAGSGTSTAFGDSSNTDSTALANPAHSELDHVLESESDQRLVDLMSNMGVNRSMLLRSLKEYRVDSLAATYFLMRRQYCQTDVSAPHQDNFSITMPPPPQKNNGKRNNYKGVQTYASSTSDLFEGFDDSQATSRSLPAPTSFSDLRNESKKVTSGVAPIIAGNKRVVSPANDTSRPATMPNVKLPPPMINEHNTNEPIAEVSKAQVVKEQPQLDLVEEKTTVVPVKATNNPAFFRAPTRRTPQKVSQVGLTGISEEQEEEVSEKPYSSSRSFDVTCPPQSEDETVTRHQTSWSVDSGKALHTALLAGDFPPTSSTTELNDLPKKDDVVANVTETSLVINTTATGAADGFAEERVFQPNNQDAAFVNSDYLSPSGPNIPKWSNSAPSMLEYSGSDVGSAPQSPQIKIASRSEWLRRTSAPPLIEEDEAEIAQELTVHQNANPTPVKSQKSATATVIPEPSTALASVSSVLSSSRQRSLNVVVPEPAIAMPKINAAPADRIRTDSASSEEAMFTMELPDRDFGLDMPPSPHPHNRAVSGPSTLQKIPDTIMAPDSSDDDTDHDDLVVVPVNGRHAGSAYIATAKGRELQAIGEIDHEDIEILTPSQTKRHMSVDKTAESPKNGAMLSKFNNNVSSRRFSLDAIAAAAVSVATRAQRSFKHGEILSPRDREENGLRKVRAGIFNAHTTSTRDPVYIVQELLRVLFTFRIPFERMDEYRFVLDGSFDRPPLPENETANPVITVSPLYRLLIDQTAYSKVRFEIEICRLPGFNLHGLRLKRLAGDTWAYKAFCNSLVEELRL